MGRKKANIHYIYKTTCLVTGRYYIGMHSTCNLNDGYLGSGLVLRRSIRKYGKESHVKEILEFCESRELLSEIEVKFITPELVRDKNCMNLVAGGTGWNKTHNKAFSDKLKNDVEFKEAYSKKMSNVNKEAFLKYESRKKILNSFSGKNHSDTTKFLISKTKAGTGLKENNSQYGTCWITKDSQNKKIDKSNINLFLLDGWSKGRHTNLSSKNSSLNKEDVLKIKQFLLNKETLQKDIAELFNVSKETISKINRGIIWKQL